MSTTLSHFKRERGVSLETLLWKRASSHIEGETWFFLSWGRNLGVHLKLRRGSQVPACGCLREVRSVFQLRGSRRGFLSSRCWRIGPCLEFSRETQCSFPVASGILGFLSRFNKGVRPRLVLRHGTLHFSRVVKGVSGLRSSSGGELGLFQEDRQGRQASHPVVRGYSVHWIHWSRCRGAGESGLIWSGGGTRRPFSLQQDPWGSTRDSSGDTDLLLWCEGNLGFLLS